jgi:hypothetical protein
MRVARFLATTILAATAGVAHAQSTAASGSVVVIPVVAETVSYTSEVVVRNPNSTSLTLNVTFYEALTSTNPGLRTCSQLTVAPLESKTFNVSAQCSPLGAGNHHGMLVLEDGAAQQTNVFFAFSRAQTPGGNGFSIEGFPIGVFSGAPADVIGLKRQAAAPVYQSNCFVGALGEAIDYQMILRDGTTNAIIGNPVTGSLNPFEMRRYLDVFSASPNGVGAPAGDYSNVRANFSVTSGGGALVSLCTVQESTFFGADFRIGKSTDGRNDGERRVACIGMDNCSDTVPSANALLREKLADATQKNVYSTILTPPDFVRCDLIGPRANDLQIRLRQWGDPMTSAVFPSSPPYSSGGTGASFFYVNTGGRAAVNGGTRSRWFIDVAFRTGGDATAPIEYGITCRAGNGMEIPWLRATVTNSDFP